MNSKLKSLFIISASCTLAVSVFSCAFKEQKSAPSNSQQSLDSAPLSFDSINQAVLSKSCISCHSNQSGNAGKINLETYQSVKENIKAIEQAVLIDGTMPKNGFLGISEKSLISRWIDAGAPEFASSAEKSPRGGVADELKPNYFSIKQTIFKPRCMTCHSPEGSAHDVPLAPLQALLHSEDDLVLPFNSKESALIHAVSRPDKKRMPPAPRLPLTEEEIGILKKWIDLGAPEDEDDPILPSPVPSVLTPQA